MKDILFNGHDVAVMLVIGLSFLIAIRVAFSSDLAGNIRAILCTFFLLNAFIFLDTLLFWGVSIRHAVFDLSPNMPLSLSFAPFAIGPALYWYFRRRFSPHFRLKAHSFLHLLPALITPLYLYWVYYRHPADQQREFILNYSIFSNDGAHFLTFLTLKNLIPAVYGAFCIALVFRAPRPRDPFLWYLSVGFTSMWAWTLMTHILGQWLPLHISDSMGIFSNYMGLALCTLLFFTYSSELNPAPDDALEQTQDSQNEESAALSQRIDAVIAADKPYLNSQLTLERFAELVQASPRQVSAAINQCFQQNFQEYINRFRITEAQRLLRDPDCQTLAISEIIRLAGFNSKATFNRLFKAHAGVTPSAYRQQPFENLPLEDPSP